MDGMSSGPTMIGRCAYEPTSMSPPCCRSYMFVSTSRTIGYAISPAVPANSGTGPTLIIWCTIGVSGIRAPAIRAIRGLHTPQQIRSYRVSISPLVVRTRATPAGPAAARCRCRAPRRRPAPAARRPAAACSRISVPARSESTTPTVREATRPPRITDSSRYGTSLATSPGERCCAGMPQARAAEHAAAQFVHPRRRAGHLDPAALGEHAERLVLPGAVPGQLHHHLRVLDREDEVGGMPGGAARVGHRALVDQDEVAPAQPGQVAGQPVADDPGADDHGAGPAGMSFMPLIPPINRLRPAEHRPRRRDAGGGAGATLCGRAYSTGISLLIRPGRCPAAVRTIRATTYTHDGQHVHRAHEDQRRVEVHVVVVVREPLVQVEAQQPDRDPPGHRDDLHAEDPDLAGR